MKKKKRITKNVKGFQLNRITGHPSYVYWQKDTNARSVGFTHNEKDFAPKRKMKYNINPNDTEDCYIKTQIEINKYNDYRSKSEYKFFRIHKDDLPLLNNIINKNKKSSKTAFKERRKRVQ